MNIMPETTSAALRGLAYAGFHVICENFAAIHPEIYLYLLLEGLGIAEHRVTELDPFQRRVG